MRRPTPEQFGRVHRQLAGQLGYFGRLRERLRELGWPPDDVYVQSVDRA